MAQMQALFESAHKTTIHMLSTGAIYRRKESGALELDIKLVAVRVSHLDTLTD